MNIRFSLLSALAALTFTVGLSTQTLAQTETVLHSFTGGSDGGLPWSSLVADASGNLYGTTNAGGAFARGTVFELSPDSSGGWTESVLYNFTQGADGGSPSADVIFDAAGNLFGTTIGGGANFQGTVFELTPTASGWAESVLYSFSGKPDGGLPTAGLVFDSAGNLYGTTTGGGDFNYGSVFELSPNSGGWSEKVMHSFGGGRNDGLVPTGGLALDSKGNLYGVAPAGGSYSLGVVYELEPQSSGVWKMHLLHSFSGGLDGGDPDTERLIFDAAGNLYGTAVIGGRSRLGVVFRLSPPSGTGFWKEKVLYNFVGNVGAYPSSGLILDPAGNLYGTCPSSNSQHIVGDVFELIPGSGDTWTEKSLYGFHHYDGDSPKAALLRDAAGNLYGTTVMGGASSEGVVFEVIP